MSEPTLRERMARLETLMESQTTLLTNHIAHHAARNKWLMGILSALAVGFILMALPGCIRLLSGIGMM